MGSRIDKFNELNKIADDLAFSLSSRLKLLLGTYLERLRARIPWVPSPVFTVQFDYEGQTVYYHMRSNDVDFQHLGGLFARREYTIPVKPKRILDLGGNIGSADLYFHCCYPDAEIISVEPVPENLRMLRRNWQSNGIRGQIIPAAAADKTGEARFYLGPVDCSSLIARPEMSGESITVECVTIPQLLRQAGWEELDLLKIDIEGGEVAIFQDSKEWAHKVKVIVGELHNGYTVADAERDLGFQFECTQTFEYPPPGSMKGLLAVRKLSVQ